MFSRLRAKFPKIDITQWKQSAAAYSYDPVEEIEKAEDLLKQKREEIRVLEERLAFFKYGWRAYKMK